MRLTLALALTVIGQTSFCQIVPDSIPLLQEVEVKAFENNRKLLEVPAAVAVVTNSQLNRFGNLTILPALNANPGVKMEERSPGSYRLNVRGSSLRSPFGVRNVKIYYNNIPYTDPSGFSAFNQIGFFNVESLEIIKGPGSSLYGAGTGGVLLINSLADQWKSGADLQLGVGSYGLRNLAATLRVGSSNFRNRITFQKQDADGYRRHTELSRQVFTWDSRAKLGDQSQLSSHFFFSDLFYETPGGLTLAEFSADPKASRPAAGIQPSAENARAAVDTKTFLGGFTYEHQLGKKWKNLTSLYAAFTKLRNPTTRNYGRTSEPHGGGRSMIQYSAKTDQLSLEAILGTEIQQGFSFVKIYGNRQGTPDTLQSDDEVSNTNVIAFGQLTLQMQSWILTAGLSFNKLRTEVNRLSVTPPLIYEKKYSDELAPRIALMKTFKSVSAYASVGRGFSPPTSAELLPSSGIISTQLEAEEGWNYELGFRASIFRNRLYIDINAYLFELKNTIVTRRDSTGGDYFINAGSTKQRGVESLVSYQVYPSGALRFIKLWGSHTLNRFNYDHFQQLDTDYSGKSLPGVARHVVSAGLDIHTRPGFYVNATYYYSDPIPLNDANTVYASPYNLLNARAGWRKKVSNHLQLDLFAHVDNIFDRKYSLGNDLNAFGGRYYNSAPGISYSGGIVVKYDH